MAKLGVKEVNFKGYLKVIRAKFIKYSGSGKTGKIFSNSKIDNRRMGSVYSVYVCEELGACKHIC